MKLSVVSKTNEILKFNFALANPVASSQTQVKYLATKVQIVSIYIISNFRDFLLHINLQHIFLK